MKLIGIAHVAAMAVMLTIGIRDAVGSAKRFEDIDAKEITETPIAKRLLLLGFVEEPIASGMYRAKTSWAKAKEALAVKEGDLFDTRSGPFGEWNRNVYIEGGFAHLSGKFEAGERGSIPAGEIDVCANLGYARPLFLWVGMPTDRMEAALKFLGATNVMLNPAQVLPADSLEEGIYVTAVILPDGIPTVATWNMRERKPRGKPMTPLVSEFLVGEGTNGFKGWNPAKVKRQATIPISKYRVPKPTKTDDASKSVMKLETGSSTNVP